MAYTKTPFVNKRPPDIDADYMNTLEEAVYNNDRKMTDLIVGVTPTYSGWTSDPTDGADITDGSLTTVCNTGSKVCSAGWEYAYFEWDLGAHTRFLVTGFGGSTATAGTAYIYPFAKYNGTWRQARSALSEWQNTPFGMSGEGDQFRLGLTSSAASTIAPAVYGLQVWRVA